jgi:hypothetical protein
VTRRDRESGAGPGGKDHDRTPGDEHEGFGELLRYTVAGYLAGFLAGALLDRLGLHRSGLGQWLVRTLSGEGESLFEGVFALRRRLAGGEGTMAEAYGWGKLLGMAAPWLIDALSRAAGVDVYGVEGFYLPYFYALSDQIGASVSGLLFSKRKAGAWRLALLSYLRHPVMAASLAVILVVPIALFAARVAGFSPDTQLRTAIETIAANLCWVPPLVGSLAERKRAREVDP